MNTKNIVIIILIAFTGFWGACKHSKLATKTTTKSKKEKAEVKKKDDNVYDLLGSSRESAKKGIVTSLKFVATDNSIFNLTIEGGTPQSAKITYFLLEKVVEERHTDDLIYKNFIKDDFSLDYLINEERELSYEYGPLNGTAVTFDRTSDGLWQVKNKQQNYTTSKILDLNFEEIKVNKYQTVSTPKLNKAFYPTSVKVGDSWDVSGEDLYWILNDISEVFEGKGTMKLKEVKVEESDSIALIDFNFTINYVSTVNSGQQPLKIQMAFSGEVKRSLKDFIDVNSILTGSYNLQRVKPNEGDTPKLDIDIKAKGTYTITEQFMKKK